MSIFRWQQKCLDRGHINCFYNNAGFVAVSFAYLRNLLEIRIWLGSV